MTLVITDSLGDVFGFWLSVTIDFILLQLFVCAQFGWLMKRNKLSERISLCTSGRTFAFGMMYGALFLWVMGDSFIKTKFAWMIILQTQLFLWKVTCFNCISEAFLTSMHWKSSKDLEAFACVRRKQLKSLALCSAKQLLLMRCVVWRFFGCFM